MKRQLKTAALFQSKPKASQRRTSLQRIRENYKRNSLRIVLSPVPYFSPFKSPRNSITNLTPIKSRALKRGVPRDGSKDVNQRIEKLLLQASASKVKKPRQSKRKNEAEKLREDLLSKKYLADGNLFGSKRALRSRLILTPKSPLIRVNRVSRQRIKSRKISMDSLNKFLSRDVVVELEKLPSEEIPLKNDVSQVDNEKSVRIDENDQVQCSSSLQIPPLRDIIIVLEKLSPTITRSSEPKKIDEDTSTKSSVVVDRESSTNDLSTGTVCDAPKHPPLLDVRILLDKLPDPECTSVADSIPSVEVEPDAELIETSQIDDTIIDTTHENLEKLHDTITDHGIEKSPQKEPTTPSLETLLDQPATSVTPALETEPVSTAITPIPDQAEATKMSDKKTPKSLGIPLRQITIAKSKFTKMNRALENPISPVRIRPRSTYVTSPLGKLKVWTNHKTTTPVLVKGTTSRSESTAVETASSSSSPLKKVASGGETSQSSIATTSSSISNKVLSSVPKPQSQIDTAGVSSRTIPSSSKHTGSELTHSSDRSDGGLAKADQTKSLVTKEIPKTTTAIPPKEKSTPLPPAKSPTSTSTQSLPLCTEVGSPLSRGQLLTAKSLAASPSVPKIISMKSPSRSRSKKLEKPYAKSPLNRGRLMTEQSLTSSPKYRDLSSGGEKSRRSSSAGSTLQRSLSNVTSSSKERKEVPYKQKWSSAGDLLKMATTDTVSDTSNDLSSVAIPLDPTPTPGVFSKSNTCAAILSTLEKTDRNKSKSEPEKLPRWPTSELAKPTRTLPKKTPDSSKIRVPVVKSVFHSQPDLSEKLAGVQIDPAKPSQTLTSQSTSTQKKMFHIPKVVPGVSGFYKRPIQTPSSLPRSGFTPSPPPKPITTRPVLDASIYPSTSYATSNARQVPAKSYQASRTKPTTTTSCFKTPLAKPHYSTSSHSSTLQPSYTSLRQTSTPKPSYTSSSQSSTINKPSISRPQPGSSKLPHTPGSHPPLSRFPYTSTSMPPASSAKSSYTTSFHSTTTNPQPSTSSQIPSAKPSTPAPYTPSVKPSYVPSSLPTRTISSTSSSTPSKTYLPTKPASGIKPLKINTSSGQSSSKSKSRPFKTAYMSSRSSNSNSFSKCLPSGPQYSPTYSKYLQNGFSYLPTAQYKMPKPTRPPSPGTSDVLGWSTAKPWIAKRPVSPPSCPSGPSDSLTSSKLTSDPSYSPLCPEF